LPNRPGTSLENHLVHPSSFTILFLPFIFILKKTKTTFFRPLATTAARTQIFVSLRLWWLMISLLLLSTTLWAQEYAYQFQIGAPQFLSPYAVAVDGQGNIYVSDVGNHRIQKLSSDGTFLLKFGSYGSGEGQFNYPSEVAIDGQGNIYVADPDNYRIQKFDARGTFLAKFGTIGSGDGQFTAPTGVAVDASGIFYVADNSNRLLS
jgi:outer membrane protein assembly factor BamB